MPLFGIRPTLDQIQLAWPYDKLHNPAPDYDLIRQCRCGRVGTMENVPLKQYGALTQFKEYRCHACFRVVHLNVWSGIRAWYIRETEDWEAGEYWE